MQREGGRSGEKGRFAQQQLSASLKLAADTKPPWVATYEREQRLLAPALDPARKERKSHKAGGTKTEQSGSRARNT